MKEFFKTIFADRGLSEDKINEFYLEFASIILLTLISLSKDRLSTEEIKQLPKMIENKKIDDLFNLIHSKYSPLEWNEMVVKHISPVCESYIEEVVLPQ